ncbi:ParA family protein [Moritella viscosa]|uniref:ParA family protein n=1 Tax=Moritella viscosa TaxID=80854 RepID=A0ABY1H9L8_9GAMM|nr:ParA family protein [Moritella viscosa]SGY87215.1 ParA family protein [Moritella viscosa]SGY93389.1 ParA family protein [Moritella viscosa]SHO28119.1 ParA family protein [Moritella viscosa]
MDIITVASIKGGSGKSTICEQLMFTLERELLLNLDPYGTYELTNALRSANGYRKINFLNITSIEQFKLAIKKYADKKIIIDCGGYESALTMAAISVATTIITPINDSIKEIATLKNVNATLTSISAKTNKSKKAYVLVNRVHHNKKSLSEFDNLTSKYPNLQLLKSTISYKKGLLETATSEGLTIPEYELNRVQEIRAKQAKKQQKMIDDKANGKTITLKKFVAPTLNQSVNEIYALTDELKSIING